VPPSGTPGQTAPDKVKVSRLKIRADFLRLARGRKWAAPGLVLQMAEAPAPSAEARAGFTVTKKIGNAVVRNRAKRRLREVARAVLPLYASPGCDYVLVAREATPDRPFASLIEDLKLALRKVHGGRAPKAEEK
jgi:ribonuclease P protein component